MKGPEWLKRWPFDRGKTLLSRVPEDERFLIDTWVHADYDSYYRENALWEPHLFLDKYRDVPGYYVGGWYDCIGKTSSTARSPRKKGPFKLLMGPWAHGTFGASYLGTVDFGPEAALSADAQMELQLKWFDQTLKAT